MLFQWSLKDVSLKYQGCFIKVSWIGSFKSVWREFWECFMGVSKMFQGCFKNVSIKFCFAILLFHYPSRRDCSWFNLSIATKQYNFLRGWLNGYHPSDIKSGLFMSYVTTLNIRGHGNLALLALLNVSFSVWYSAFARIFCINSATKYFVSDNKLLLFWYCKMCQMEHNFYVVVLLKFLIAGALKKTSLWLCLFVGFLHWYKSFNKGFYIEKEIRFSCSFHLNMKWLLSNARFWYMYRVFHNERYKSIFE